MGKCEQEMGKRGEREAANDAVITIETANNDCQGRLVDHLDDVAAALNGQEVS